MLEAAFDAGFATSMLRRCMDLARPRAAWESFSARHRADVTVTTKYGVPPPKNQGLIGLARSIARPVVKALPGLKRGLSRLAGKCGAACGEGQLHRCPGAGSRWSEA